MLISINNINNYYHKIYHKDKCMAVSIESLCSCMHLIIDNNILQFLYDVIITQKINVGSKVYTTVKQDILLLYA